MMTNTIPTSKKYTEITQQLQSIYQNTLEKHGAIDMIAGHEFICYVIEEDDNLVGDIWSWGAHYGKLISGSTMDELYIQLKEIYE